MSISAAIGELAEILAGLERTEKEIRSVALAETEVGTEAVTARVNVGVPILDEGHVNDDITIDAANADLTDGHVDVTLEFSIPTRDNGSLDTYSFGGNASGGKGTVTSAAGTPPYKDPKALEAVYQEYDTFTAMTAALDVDVTSETVRRYMIKHGIHDPEETAGERDSQSDDTEEGTASNAANSADEASVMTREPDAKPDEEAKKSDFGDQRVADLLASVDLDENDSLVADGLGVPQGLTVAELTAVLDQSRTVSEVKTALGLDHDQTRRLLAELGVIDLVTGRITDQRGEITLEAVVQRIHDADPTAN
ncbi:hypothetical protein [Natrinema salifodinae]|uniref:Uncharacterized protein n=1 Tax=Natrinema salifodinae TaxID=1202768 RepID=A0A1I0QQU7_9EURY|nr:hypothetical protein [Natrinema salifodinae]SEW29882.1 hypothetical protein SAMN05216285_3774 [Natrinema salifodinae]